ncbi:hypothetical protein PVK06_040769 [Gossypium arboreum]|uniref:RNase H type-1 domain-containing protein n=1 Tax=Gossypium arboreum TaxID=29729 RepID=A0ABR0N6E4_GOSAR|nr:hypothetical protein PVK06_040769 [Gossypium arboreum]
MQNCRKTVALHFQVSWDMLFTTILWDSSNGRNDGVFNGRLSLAIKILEYDVSLAMFSNVSCILRRPRWVQWRKLPSEVCILHTNGAGVVKPQSGLASMRGLIHDEMGSRVKGFMLKIGTSYSVQAELWSVHEGLQLAKTLGISKLIVELDASLVVRFLTRPFEDDQIGTLI